MSIRDRRMCSVVNKNNKYTAQKAIFSIGMFQIGQALGEALVEAGLTSFAAAALVDLLLWLQEKSDEPEEPDEP